MKKAISLCPYLSEKILPPLPDNRAVVFNRSINTLSKLKRDERKSGQVVKAMLKTIDSGFVEPIPPEEIIPSDTKLCWYIPVFPVAHARKTTAYVCVFCKPRLLM